MNTKNDLRSAHGETVNSVYVSFDARIVISVDDDSIRIWNPVSGTELYQTGTDSDEDSVIPGLGMMYRMETSSRLDS